MLNPVLLLELASLPRLYVGKKLLFPSSNVPLTIVKEKFFEIATQNAIKSATTLFLHRLAKTAYVSAFLRPIFVYWDLFCCNRF